MVVKTRQYLDWYLVLTLALGLFIGGMAVNVAQLGVDYVITSWTDRSFLKWQEEQIRQYQEDHPGSHPETKDFHSGDDSKSL